MKKLLSFILAALSFSVNAQFKNPVYSNWDSGYSVGIHGRYQASSNALTSKFVWDIYKGAFLSRTDREKISNNLNKQNRLGMDLDFGIYAKHLPDSSKGIGWFINIADRTHANATFSKDMFDLAMFGNAMFADKTADLSDIKLSLLTYKQFEIGILKQVQKQKGKLNLALGVSLLTGNRNLSLSINQASLYTEPNGEYLDGEIHGEIRTSSISSAQYFDANGIGFASSLNVGYESDKFGVKLVAEDLGLIVWSKNLQHTILDSTFTFEGVDVDLFSSDGNPFSSINLDTVVDGFISKGQESNYRTIVPGSIRLEGFYALNSKKWRLYAGVQYRVAPSYFPYIYLGTSSPLPKGFFIDGRFAYGGFGSWNVGLEVRKRFAEVIEVRLGTNNLEGYLIPMVGTSQSAYISIAGFF